MTKEIFLIQFVDREANEATRMLKYLVNQI